MTRNLARADSSRERSGSSLHVTAVRRGAYRCLVERSERSKVHLRSRVRRTGDQARAEDLAQEAFVRAIEHQPDKPRAWLFAVAANLARPESEHPPQGIFCVLVFCAAVAGSRRRT